MDGNGAFKFEDGEPTLPEKNVSPVNLSTAILIDVTAFCENPFLTGIQRQLEALMRQKGSRTLLPYWIEDRHNIQILPQNFLGLIETFFVSEGDQLAAARMHYHGSHRGINNLYIFIKYYARRFGLSVPADEIFGAVGAVLCTEYVLNEVGLDFYSSLLLKHGHKCFFIEHDLLFWTLRSHFSRMSEHIGHIKHLRFMRNADNVGAVSQLVVDDLHRLARRSPLRDTVIIVPGGNSLGEYAPSQVPDNLRVAVIGTIEPRKCSEIILDVLEKLHSEIGLEGVFCGTISGLCSDTTKARFENLEDPFLPIQVIRSPTDANIRDVVLGATVTIYLSDGEGFGVPPLESLGLGVPVIATGAVPALCYISSGGQVRLNGNTEAELSAAILRFADRQYASLMRKEAQKIKVPTWEEYAEQIFAWIDKTKAANKATWIAQYNANNAQGLTLRLAEYFVPQSIDGRKIGQQTLSLFDQLGLSNIILHSVDTDEGGVGFFAAQCREFCATMAELYRIWCLFDARPAGDGVQYFARQILSRTGSPEDYLNWRRTWPLKRDAFSMLSGFYNSEEASEKDAGRPARAGEIIAGIAPLITLALDVESDDDEFIIAAYSATIASLPSEVDITNHLARLAEDGPGARHHLLRSLLSSDPAVRRFTHQIEGWSLVMAVLGVESPSWALGRAAQLLFANEKYSDDDDYIDADTVGRPTLGTWEPRELNVQSMSSAIARKMLAGQAAEWLPVMRIGAHAIRAHSAVTVSKGWSGHLVFGPYFRLPKGRYRARFELELELDDDRRLNVEKSPVAVIEAAVAEPPTFLAQADLILATGSGQVQELDFVVSTQPPQPIEVRLWTSGELGITLKSLSVRRLSRDVSIKK